MACNASCVCGGCDFNGDGWLDLAVNKKFSDTVFVYFGSATFDTVSDLTLRGENIGDHFGGRMSTGDINGDGVDDLVISAGAYPYSLSFEYRGKIYVYAEGQAMDTIPAFTQATLHWSFRYKSSRPQNHRAPR